MTRDEIRSRVEEIKHSSGDVEIAHSMEDNLREDLLRYIASREGEYQGLAQEVLMTNQISFPRWCA